MADAAGKGVALQGIFTYNDQCLLPFEQVLKRDVGEAKLPWYEGCAEKRMSDMFPEYVQGYLRVCARLFR
jgi:hypothetical protein